MKGRWKIVRQKSWHDRHAGQVNRMSSRQFSLGTFLETLPGRVVSYEVLRGLNMQTVGSFMVRGYLEEREVRGEKVVYWTKEGSAAVKTFPAESFDRKPSDRFSSTLSLELYDRSKQ